MKEAVIVAACRTAVGRAKKGSLKDTRPDDMTAVVLKEAIARTPGLEPEQVDDVIIGCAMPEAEQGMNVARVAAAMAGIPYTVPAMTINRFCSSGLQAIALAAERIMCGFSEVILAGGVESMTLVPMGGWKFCSNPHLTAEYPEFYTPMGITAEIVAKKFNVTREDQDKFAFRSHQNAVRAVNEGLFRDEIVPVKTKVYEASNGRVVEREIVFDKEELPRAETSMEVLGNLKPAFDPKGSVTAGNSSPLSDGAAAVMIMSAEKAKALGLEPLGVFRRFEAVGVPPEIMGIGPAVAIPKLLDRTGLKLSDIGVIEVNEAFAAQSVYCQREVGISDEQLNVNGGAIALGHPLGGTGAKLTVQVLYEMKRRGLNNGIVSMCIGGGMGAAALIERIA